MFSFFILPASPIDFLSILANNPLDRLRVNIEPAAAGGAAWDIAAALAPPGDPPMIVREHLIEHGFIDIDPCNLHEGEAEIVAKRMVDVLAQARASKIPRRQLAATRTGGVESLVDCLD
ncbi:MAG: hypothetical protein ACR2Q4_09075 [Geminicoccaceae bacterium]